MEFTQIDYLFAFGLIILTTLFFIFRYTKAQAQAQEKQELVRETTTVLPPAADSTKMTEEKSVPSVTLIDSLVIKAYPKEDIKTSQEGFKTNHQHLCDLLLPNDPSQGESIAREPCREWMGDQDKALAVAQHLHRHKTAPNQAVQANENWCFLCVYHVYRHNGRSASITKSLKTMFKKLGSDTVGKLDMMSSILSTLLIDINHDSEEICMAKTNFATLCISANILGCLEKLIRKNALDCDVYYGLKIVLALTNIGHLCLTNTPHSLFKESLILAQITS